jgi:hypothetical protein
MSGWFTRDMGASPAFLAHRVKRETDQTRDLISHRYIVTRTTRYAVFPLRLPEPPAGGKTTTMVRCGECGREMRCQVYSRPLVRRVRRRHMVLGLAMIACVIGLFCYQFIGLLTGFRLTGPRDTWARILVVLAAPVSIFALGIPGLGFFAHGLTEGAPDIDEGDRTAAEPTACAATGTRR